MASKWNSLINNIADLTRRNIWKASNVKKIVKDFEHCSHKSESKFCRVADNKIGSHLKNLYTVAMLFITR